MKEDFIMKKISKILAIILAILMVISIIPITASAATLKYAGESVFWDINNGVLMIYGSGEMYSYTSSTVPWRSYKDKIKEISINEDITSIGDYAFYGLNITEVEIPEGVRKIGTYAFANCTSLSKVVIRKGVEIIDTNAFANCNSLKKVYYYSPQNDWGLINIRTGNDYLLNAELFVNGNGKISWEYEKETGTLTFNGMGEIPDYYIRDEDRFIKQPWDEFEKDIKHIVINDGITVIGSHAFANCISLESVTMSSVKTIDNGAFECAESLETIYMSSSIQVIENSAFYECVKLTYIYYSGTQKEWNNVSIGPNLNDELETAKVYTSDYVVYSNYGDYQGITGGDIVSWIFDANTYTLTISGEGKIAQDFVPLLQTYKYLGMLRPWRDYTYDIKKVVIDSGITSVGAYVFRFSPNLTEVVIPTSVIEISNSAFHTCDSITDVYYAGTEEQWKNIVVGTNNESLLNANIHYNYVECEHNFDSSFVTKPSCTHYGYTTYICSICNDSYVDDFVDPVCRYDAVITPPTCTQQGYTTYTCVGCENSFIDDYVNATGHGEYIVSSITEPTCTKKGYTQYKCSNGCGDNYVKATADALGHDYGDVKTVAPTCTEKGYNSQVCTRCGYENKFDYVDALGHEFSVSLVTPPTCTEEGYTIYECSVCGETDDADYVDALGHKYEVKSVTEPTCTKMGYTTYECSVCEGTTTSDYLEAIGHNYEEWITVVEPQCGIKGKEKAVCTECGEETEQDIPSLSHDYSELQIDYDATCTTAGQMSQICSRCQSRINIKTIPATGHSFGEWEQVTEGTCNEYVQFKRECTGCGQVNMMSAPADHDYSIEYNIVDATCTKSGSKTVECIYCGDTATQTIPATGHNHEAVVTAPTCTEQGYTTYTRECGDSYVEDYVNATGHSHTSEITTPATHLSEGIKTFTCTCGDTYTETIEKLEKHNYDAVVTAPTCTEQGYTTYTCECGDTYIADYIDATGHTPANAVEENYVAPTCTENGSKDIVGYCSVCDEEISRETETIEATGHADNDGDGYCDADNELLDPSVECECNCHKTGISKFFFNLILFFQKIFGSNDICDCGVAHY